MTGAVTWAQIGTLGAVLLAGATILIHYFRGHLKLKEDIAKVKTDCDGSINHVAGRVDESKSELHERINRMREELHKMELRATEKYATVSHLQEVEGRLVEAISTLSKNIADLTKEIRTGRKNGSS